MKWFNYLSSLTALSRGEGYDYTLMAIVTSTGSLRHRGRYTPQQGQITNKKKIKNSFIINILMYYESVDSLFHAALMRSC